MRDRLIAAGLPYVIENVEGAPLRAPVRLCGSAFGLGVWRHRLFESNLPLAGTGCAHGLVPAPVDVAGSCPAGGVARAASAMGIDWLPWDSLVDAVPPAFAAFLGRQVASRVDVGLASSPSSGVPSSPAAVESSPSAGRLASPLLEGVPSPLDDVLPSPVVDRYASRFCVCGSVLVRPATGRWPVHCSKSCRQASWRRKRAGSADG